MDNNLQSIVQSFITTTKELSGGNGGTKELRERKKQAKQHIIDIMKEKQLTYIELDGYYLVLKQTFSKPTLNAEFATRAFTEFHKDQQRLTGDPAQVAICFGHYLFGLQKHLAEQSYDLKLSKKKPMAAMLFEEFNTPMSSVPQAPFI